MSPSRRIRPVIAALGLVLTLAAAPVQRTLAAPSPSSLTIGVNGAAPSSQAFSGGPITGSADASGSAAPVACTAPACETIPLTLSAPAGFPANSINFTIHIDFTPPTGNPGGAGLDGLDVWIFDSGSNVIGSATTGASPGVATAIHVNPGSYTVEISGEAAASSQAYTGNASAVVAPASPPLATPATTQLAFAPATVVSPTILGGEPQISYERPLAAAKPGAGLDPARGYIDWPVSSRTMIGTLWRTTNGGDSYRQLVDLSCGPRQVPNCFTGGGGDTVNRVNNYDGTLMFGDQESLAQEAFASSIDHGDSFPLARQTPVTSPATGVDRQWISTVDKPGVMAGPVSSFELAGLYSYHLPDVGEVVAGVGTDGIVRPGIAEFQGVTQSGPSRIDTQAGSHGSGWFYQSFRDASSFKVAVAPLGQYQLPTAYTVNTVTSDVPQVFPWITLDTQGNLYAVWVAPDGNLYLSFSRINDPANDPTATPPGTPATRWSPKVRINPTSVGSTVFPEVVAGDSGRIAITYMGTPDYSGKSDGAQASTRWVTYAAISLNALDSAPVFQTGLVSHRIAHVGSICTNGTTCVVPPQGDRSLLDMIDVTMDSDGRASVVFMDNNNTFAEQEASLGSKGSPWIKVAKLASGPSLLRGHGPYSITYPTAFRAARSGDATWPNTAAGANLPSLDILGSGVFADGTMVVGRIDLAQAGAAAFARDITAYASASSTDLPASRLQYVIRFEHASDTYYMAAEADSAGALTFLGGRVDSTSAVSNVNSAVAVGYRPQTAFPVTGQIQGNTLLLRARMADFGVGLGSTLISYQAFSLAGPSDGLLAAAPETSQVFAAMRTVDAAPPMDAVIAGPEQQPLVPIPGASSQPVALLPIPNTAAAQVGALPALLPLVLVSLFLLLSVGRRRRQHPART